MTSIRATDTSDVATARGRDTFVPTAGLLCVLGAVIGAAGGLVTAFLPPAVAEDQFRYPFTPVGFFLAESSFLLNHLLLLVGLIGLGRSGATGAGRIGRYGMGTAVAGMALLSLCEVRAMTLVNATWPSPQTDLLDAGYGAATIAIGVGLTLAGIAVIRTGRWSGWPKYVTLACGLAVFLLVLPGVFGPFLAGRLVLTAWMLMFAALGVALLRTKRSVVLENTVDIARPMDVVFDYLSDLRNEREWNPKMTSVELLAGEPISDRSRYRARWAGSGELTVRYLRYERPNGWASTAPGRLMTVDFTAYLTPTAAGTHCVFRMELVPHGVAVLLTPILAAWMQRQEANNMRYVKAACER